MDTKQEQFLELLTPLKKPLLGYIRYLLWNKGDVEDALQNILTEAYRKFGEFEPGTDFKSWIFKVASYTVFNMNRRYKRDTAKERSLTETIEPPDPGKSEQESDYQQLLTNQIQIDVLEQMSNEVKTSLDVLNQDERSVFLLRVLAGLSYKEIAGILEIPPGSVMGWLSRARSKLRQYLVHYAKETGYLYDKKL